MEDSWLESVSNSTLREELNVLSKAYQVSGSIRKIEGDEYAVPIILPMYTEEGEEDKAHYKEGLFRILHVGSFFL